MGNMKTPGVYILEKNAFPNSVVEVATAVPAFIGYTEKAENKGLSLHLKPWRISSLAEFHEYFGFGPTGGQVRFSLAAPPEAPADADARLAAAQKQADTPLAGRDAGELRLGIARYVLQQTHGLYLLYHAVRHFFLNNGGPCYVVSVGGYAQEGPPGAQQPKPGVAVVRAELEAGLKELEKELEPTMIVVPEAVLLSRSDCEGLQQSVLGHCGLTMKNRVALLDVWEGYKGRKDGPRDCVNDFRDGVQTSFLDYAAAYYPWVHSSVVAERDMSFLHIAPDSRATLVQALKDDLALRKVPEEKRAAQAEEIDRITTAAGADELGTLLKSLPNFSDFYRTLQGEMARRLNLLPPSAAMAGIYTMVDNTRGVWKAPANVSMNGVIAPAVQISHADQEDLNVTPQGKSINAIRTFTGEGTLVWGARTLDGNSLDWRYVNVRRTMIMLEESIRLAAKALVFEPNVGGTWVTMKGMISNFLTGIWKRGGLAGATPEDAFSVHVGLGETMTPEDILEGILRVTVLVAISRPAEFIEITFQQQMQKS
jgi:phage tail sheath protein FI